MYVIEQSRPTATAIPGIDHATWAGQADGIDQLSVWNQRIAPGAATPPHRHDCDEVVLCHAGQGELHIDGQAHRFGPSQTVVLPKGRMHQIFNTGGVPLCITGIFAQTPVAAYLPDGKALDLPWRS